MYLHSVVQESSKKQRWNVSKGYQWTSMLDKGDGAFLYMFNHPGKNVAAFFLISLGHLDNRSNLAAAIAKGKTKTSYKRSV